MGVGAAQGPFKYPCVDAFMAVLEMIAVGLVLLGMDEQFEGKAVLLVGMLMYVSGPSSAVNTRIENSGVEVHVIELSEVINGDEEDVDVAKTSMKRNLLK